MNLPAAAKTFDEAVALLEQMASLVGPSAFASAGKDSSQGPATEKAARGDQRYRSLIERLPVVTFMYGLNDGPREVYISPQIEGLLGFSQEEWLENPLLWYRQLHPDDRQRWVEQFAQTCSTGKNFRAEYRLINRAGQVVWIQGECQVIRDDNGIPLYMQGIAVDITHLKQAAQAVEAQRAAEAANAAKSEFLARMSHEIRTPLNGVVGMIDLLCATGMSELQQRYAQLARDAADALLVVINDILDFSKIEAGKVEIEQLEFDLYKLIADCTELLSPLATKKKLHMACSLSDCVPRNVVGDPNRIRQIITNLVTNALKFTTQGSINVRVSLERMTEQNAMVKLQVEDTGIGIPPNRIDRLFKSFSQVDTSTTRKFGGTGLGLAICKRLAELMGGQIGVNSVDGKGTTFWFTVDLKVPTSAHRAETADAVAASATQSSQSDSLRGLHLLVAEDNELNQFVTGETLSKAGCTCDIVADGLQAVEAAQTKRYDAILMDCQMPGMDGMEASRRIRERESNTNSPTRMPIIALTAEALQGDRERCLGAGMDGYVTKPIDAAELFEAIRSLVKKSATRQPSQEHRPVAADKPAPPPEVVNVEPIDVDELFGRCLSDGDFARTTLQKFHRRALDDIQRLRQGVSNGNPDELSRLAHNLKAVAAHVGASPLAKLAFEIEQAGARRELDLIEEKIKRLDEEARRCVNFIPQAIDRLQKLPKPGKAQKQRS